MEQRLTDAPWVFKKNCYCNLKNEDYPYLESSPEINFVRETCIWQGKHLEHLALPHALHSDLFIWFILIISYSVLAQKNSENLGRATGIQMEEHRALPDKTSQRIHRRHSERELKGHLEATSAKGQENSEGTAQAKETDVSGFKANM